MINIPNPKSHNPTVYDNTEKDLILVPPSVLDGNLRDFESFIASETSILEDIVLIITLAVPILSNSFGTFMGLSGETIKGAFTFATLVVVSKLIRDIYIVYFKNKNLSRASIIKSLRDESNNLKNNNKKNNHADEKTK